MPTYTHSEDEGKITIKFELTDEYGSIYSSESTLSVFYDLGDNVLDTIGRQLNVFLRQCGYYRGGDLMLMDSLSEDELDAVSSFLYSYRIDHPSKLES